MNGRARPRIELRCVSPRRYLSSKNPCFPSNVVLLESGLQELTAENAEVSQKALRLRIFKPLPFEKVACLNVLQ